MMDWTVCTLSKTVRVPRNMSLNSCIVSLLTTPSLDSAHSSSHNFSTRIMSSTSPWVRSFGVRLWSIHLAKVLLLLFTKSANLEWIPDLELGWSRTAFSEVANDLTYTSTRATVLLSVNTLINRKSDDQFFSRTTIRLNLDIYFDRISD